MAHDVTLILGDGVGPELAEATKMCIEATGVSINWDEQEAGVGIHGFALRAKASGWRAPAFAGTCFAERARLSSPARRRWRFAVDGDELGGHGERRAGAGRFGRTGGGFGFEPGDNVGNREGAIEPLHDEAEPIAAVLVDGEVQFSP